MAGIDTARIPASRKAPIAGTVAGAFLVQCCGKPNLTYPEYVDMPSLDLHCWHVDVMGWNGRRISDDKDTGLPRFCYWLNGRAPLIVIVRPFTY